MRLGRAQQGGKGLWEEAKGTCGGTGRQRTCLACPGSSQEAWEQSEEEEEEEEVKEAPDLGGQEVDVRFALSEMECGASSHLAIVCMPVATGWRTDPRRPGWKETDHLGGAGAHYNKKVFGVCPQLLAQSSLNPWNALCHMLMG